MEHLIVDDKNVEKITVIVSVMDVKVLLLIYQNNKMIKVNLYLYKEKIVYILKGFINVDVENFF